MGRRVGILGGRADPQVRAVTACLAELEAEVVSLEPDDLEKGVPYSLRDGELFSGGQPMEHVDAFWLRGIRSPLAPHIEQNGELQLFDDWYVRYMRMREREAFMLSWLVGLAESGRALINAPVAARVAQLKPHQISTFHRLGLPVPRTLVSNDPTEVEAFRREVADVVFKPADGGGFCAPLDRENRRRLKLLTASPVIFQERIQGEDIRVMVLDGEILSAAIVEVPEGVLDFRTDETYSSGQGTYRPIELPAKIQEVCRRAASGCGLRFAGVDLKRTAKGEFFLLECNSSPIYLDVELKLGHPISRRLAEALLKDP